MSLSLKVYAKSVGKVPSKALAERAKTAIREAIQNQTDAVESLCLPSGRCRDKSIMVIFPSHIFIVSK